VGEAVDVEQLGTGSRNERSVSGSRHIGNLLQQSDVLRMPSELVVTHKNGERISAKRAVLLFIDLFEERTLVKFRGLFHITEQLVFSHVHEAQLEHGAGFGIHYQVMQAAP